jgi:hypothetical protein
MKNVNKKRIVKPIRKTELSKEKPDNKFFEQNDQKIEPEKRPDFNLDRDYFTGEETPEQTPETGEGKEGEKSEPVIIKKPEK